jgi:hypothetical protein
MDSFQASLWREMAKEAFAAADRIGDLGVRREIFLMAARYMAMADGSKPGRQPTKTGRDSAFLTLRRRFPALNLSLAPPSGELASDLAGVHNWLLFVDHCAVFDLAL